MARLGEGGRSDSLGARQGESRTCLAPCIRPKGRAEKTAIDSCVVVGTRSWTIRIGTSDGRPGCTASDRVRTPARPAWHAPRRRKAMIETPICGSVLQTCYPGRAGVRLRSMAVHRRLASNVLQRTTRGARPYQCPAADRARPGFRRPFGPGAGYTALNTYPQDPLAKRTAHKEDSGPRDQAWIGS